MSSPSFAERFRITVIRLHVPPRERGFTLVELLATIGIIAVLAGLLLPVAGKLNKKWAEAADLGNIRSYGVAVHMMMSEAETVTTADVYHGNANVESYCGGAQAAYKMLGSSLYATKNRAFAASMGKSVTNTTRAYTVNEALFPAKPNDPSTGYVNPGWETDPARTLRLRQNAVAPLLYTGVYFSGHNGAYITGSRGHAYPVYSELKKESPNGTIMGKTMVLFVGGHAGVVDFAKEDLYVAPAISPWWNRPTLTQ